MARHQPFQIIGYHSCDKSVGTRVLNGEIDLHLSNNRWDWLADGIYFWEQNPKRALEYAVESSKGEQFNKIRISEPFVIGAIIELGNCLNIIESESLTILNEAYSGIVKLHKQINKPLPTNTGNNRQLDCAVIRYIHQTRREEKQPEYDTIRAAFSEGESVYPTSPFTTRHHLQVCVRNPDLIKGYFLPRPIKEFNPHI